MKYREGYTLEVIFSGEGWEANPMEKILPFLREAFEDDIYTEAYWNWKYEENPLGRSIIILAIDGNTGEIVGCRAFWRWLLWDKGRTTVAFQPCDTAVSPQHRRRGLFSIMTLRAIEVAAGEGCVILFNNPNPEAMKGYLKLGWSDMGGLRWYIKPVKARAFSLASIKGFLKGKACFWHNPRQVNWNVLQENGVVTLLDECRKACSYSVWTARTGDFYRWRYGFAPHRAYGVSRWPAEGICEAFVIYGCAKRGTLDEIQILDIVATPGNSGAVKAAIKKIVKREHPDLISFAASKGHPFLQEVQRCGFIPLPKSANFVAAILSKEAQGAVYPPSKPFGIGLGDVDTF